MDKTKRNRLIMWLVLSGVTLIAATLILVLRKDYSTRGFSDATFIPGVVVLFLFLLRLVRDAGTFDLVSYSISRIFQGTKEKSLDGMKTASEYVEGKRQERLKKDRYYLPYIIIAVAFIVAGVILAYI
ncbi:MAG TPA: DUF3899 domain-containing protein [Bacilli bacterium]|jgi:hypothetical protein|nr:DUF3899 domain-containing protein [Bacillota bacterium]NLI51881.1 DUF3899 domain-containing protein [Erysipelotrichaceae bacterium]OQC50146.1 MAG: hypothetical protein BWX57_00462 [Tenericutes bacterium ADurb.Bin024]HOA11324.1 DUF3899 domain-containing protein [Bacilli bacterium]TAH57806.1 MAG: DUF3899 domain-containing protein [Bacillota bacterium]